MIGKVQARNTANIIKHNFIQFPSDKWKAEAGDSDFTWRHNQAQRWIRRDSGLNVLCRLVAAYRLQKNLTTYKGQWGFTDITITDS